jgi:PAS domain S-box-containing protein
MAAALRDSGIKILGRVPWGTHFCQFYQSRKDLLDILVPYFKAGLDSNEFCMWICSEPLGVADARKALGKAVPGLARHIRKGRIEILPHTEWYLRQGRFSARRVLKAWADKLNGALSQGYEGLRLSGNTFWLEKKEWRAFTEYEEEINRILCRHPMIALCTYSLDRCDAHEVIDVLDNHQQALIRRAGKWTLVASSVIKKAREDLQETQDRFREIFEGSPVGIELYDAEGRLIEANPSSLKIFGVSGVSEIRGFRLFEDPNLSREAIASLREGQAVRHEMAFDFGKVRRRRLYRTSRSGVIDLDVQITPIVRRGKEVRGYLVQVMDISERKRAEKALRTAYKEMEDRVKKRTSELARTVRKLQKEAADRGEAEKALSEQSRIMETFFNSTITPLVLLDKDFDFVRVNEAYARACQRRASEFPGHNHFELYPNEENEAIFRNVVKTKKPYRALAKPFAYPDHPEWGVTYWDWTLTPVLDDTGDVSSLVFSLNDVSEEARAHEELRRSESLLRSVLDTLPVGVWIIDRQGRIVAGNPAGRRIWGGSMQVGIEWYGEYKGWWADTGKMIRPEEWAAARAVTKGETSLEEEIEIESFDGQRKFILHSAVPIRDADGGIIGAIVLNQDITERRQIREALRTASEYTRGLIEASLDPLVTISAEGKITDVNRATELATGVPRAELIGSDFSDYFTDAGKARAGYREVFLKGTVRDYPLAIRHASGKVTEVLYNAAVYRGESGEVAGVFAAARDVTELKIAEQERRRLAIAVEQIAEGIAIMDLEGRILSANPAFGNLHALRPQEIVGRPLGEILQVDPGDQEPNRKMRESMGSGKTWNWHLTRRMRDGRIRELDLTVSPIRDGSGRLINTIAVERDVTQETILQERIRQWQRMEALGTLAGGIAHDFNNILLPIQINTELALAGEKEGSQEARRLDQVLEAARRGKEMVKQIIAFSRQKEQGRQATEITPIIRESLKFLRVSLPKNIEIAERIESESAMAVADPTQVHQILMNLGSNAAHAMREKGGLLEVALSGISLDEEDASRPIDLKPGAYLRLTVRDTGHGMAPDVAEHVFEPFFTTKKQGEGTGMGLAVVHGIVKNHGGAITVESELGDGTTFTIYLPRIMGVPPAKEETRQAFPTGTERVLFVDDEDIQVRAMNKLLEHLGYRVVGLSDPRAALELFRRQAESFDLAILDQTMPHMQGTELAGEILRIKPGLPVILCTGYSDTVREEEDLPFGISSLMMKPFSVKDIAETIRRVLALRA